VKRIITVLLLQIVLAIIVFIVDPNFAPALIFIMVGGDLLGVFIAIAQFYHYFGKGG
jgi:hypothetical protein